MTVFQIQMLFLVPLSALRNDPYSRWRSLLFWKDTKSPVLEIIFFNFAGTTPKPPATGTRLMSRGAPSCRPTATLPLLFIRMRVIRRQDPSTRRLRLPGCRSTGAPGRTTTFMAMASTKGLVERGQRWPSSLCVIRSWVQLSSLSGLARSTNWDNRRLIFFSMHSCSIVQSNKQRRSTDVNVRKLETNTWLKERRPEQPAMEFELCHGRQNLECSRGW